MSNSSWAGEDLTEGLDQYDSNPKEAKERENSFRFDDPKQIEL